MAAASLILLAACWDSREGAGGGAPPSPAPPATAEAAAPQGTLLEPGQPKTAELTGGATAVYLLALEANAFVRLYVEQPGIDVVARLINPQGDFLIQFDKLSSARPEQVLWVTDTGGVYRLVVEAFGTAASGGQVQVLFDVARPADEQDRQRHAAEQLFAEGDALRRKPDADSRHRAEEKLRQAVDLWRQLGDRTRYADGLFLLARTYGYRDRQLAIDTFEEVVALLEDDADLLQKAAAVHEIASLHYDAGQLGRAAEVYQQAIPLRQRAKHLRGEANTYNDLGLTYKMLGEVDQALANYREALERFRALGDLEAEALALHNLGRGLMATGLLPDSLDHLEQALSLRERRGDLSGQARTLIAIGQVLIQQEQLDQALEAQRRALELSRQAQDRTREAVALADIGVTYQGLERFDRAVELFEQALDSFRDLGDRHNEANTLHNLGWTFDRLDQDRRAQDYFRQALALYEATEHRHGQIMTLRSMARVERQLGDLKLARRLLERSLAEVERLRSLPRSDALRYSYFATKHGYYEAYVDLLMELHRREPDAGHDAAALTASERARARSQLDALAESGAELQRGAAPELRARERALEAEIEALESERQQLADDGVGQARVAAIERRLRALFLEHGRVQGDIRRASPRYAALTQPRPLAAEQIQRQVVDRDTILLEYELGEERSYLWAVTPGELRSFELPARRVIERTAQRTYKLLSSSNLTASKVSAELALEKLSRLLLQPVAPLLADKRLLIVSDGALQYIPFSALPEPRAGDDSAASGGGAEAALPLAETHEVVSIPSASTLAVLRGQIAGRRRPVGSVAVFADPVFELEDPRFRDEASEDPRAGIRGAAQPEPRRYERLIYSRREAEDILALAPAASTFAAIGFEAHRDAVMSGRLADYRFLHFATHGVLHAEHPELSRLVLSRRDSEGNERDGFVYAHQIYDLELAADLVVLSACETALGAEIRGEGLLGLTQGSLYAGAASVLVSLWNVDDQATAELMARFYSQLLAEGRRPAAALRAAQVSIRREKRWQPPYFWAGFVLQGEWRD